MKLPSLAPSRCDDRGVLASFVVGPIQALYQSHDLRLLPHVNPQVDAL
jgi:hypothetical protein